MYEPLIHQCKELKLKNNIIVMLPHTFLDNYKTLMLRTIYIGWYLRWIGINRIEKVIIYKDLKENNNAHRIKKYLEIINYLVTAPYLRKYIPKKDHLKFAGIVRPLQTPNQLGGRLGNNIYREGYIIKNRNGELIIDIGLKNKLIKISEAKLNEKNYLNEKFITVKITRDDYITVEQTPEKYFWKPIVQYIPDIGDFITNIKSHGTIIIGATKYGKNINKLKPIFDEIKINNKTICVIIGPSRGRFINYFKELNINIPIQYWINFIPEQGTKTVRIEEAFIYITTYLTTL